MKEVGENIFIEDSREPVFSSISIRTSNIDMTVEGWILPARSDDDQKSLLAIQPSYKYSSEGMFLLFEVASITSMSPAYLLESDDQ